jgi:hypothetical protein
LFNKVRTGIKYDPEAAKRWEQVRLALQAGGKPITLRSVLEAMDGPMRDFERESRSFIFNPNRNLQQATPAARGGQQPKVQHVNAVQKLANSLNDGDLKVCFQHALHGRCSYKGCKWKHVSLDEEQKARLLKYRSAWKAAKQPRKSRNSSANSNVTSGAGGGTDTVPRTTTNNSNSRFNVNALRAALEGSKPDPIAEARRLQQQHGLSNEAMMDLAELFTRQ